MKWLDRLALWYLSKRLGMPYGTWLAVPRGCLWQTIEKLPGPGTDPLDKVHIVALKVMEGQ